MLFLICSYLSRSCCSHHPAKNNASFFLQTVVQRGIAMEGATDALIQLIKDHGRWVDPPAEE
jgi:hypothetical protein